MKTTAKKCELLIADPPKGSRVDPVRIIAENIEPGKGRIILVCFTSAWTGYWGAMGDRTVEQFFIQCDVDYLEDCMGMGYVGNLRAVIKVAQDALRARMPKMTPQRAARLERLQRANELIKVISDHGRRFFYNEGSGRVARLQLDAKGKPWIVDDYTGKPVFIGTVGGYERKWRGFSHGGTLRDLIIDLRDYVAGTKPASEFRWRIAPGGYSHGDLWGYGAESVEAVHAAAFALPIFKAPKA